MVVKRLFSNIEHEISARRGQSDSRSKPSGSLPAVSFTEGFFQLPPVLGEALHKPIEQSTPLHAEFFTDSCRRFRDRAPGIEQNHAHDIQNSELNSGIDLRKNRRAESVQHS